MIHRFLDLKNCKNFRFFILITKNYSKILNLFKTRNFLKLKKILMFLYK